MNFLTRTVTAASDIFTWCSLLNSGFNTSPQNPNRAVWKSIDDHGITGEDSRFNTSFVEGRWNGTVIWERET